MCSIHGQYNAVTKTPMFIAFHTKYSLGRGCFCWIRFVVNKSIVQNIKTELFEVCM